MLLHEMDVLDPLQSANKPILNARNAHALSQDQIVSLCTQTQDSQR